MCPKLKKKQNNLENSDKFTVVGSRQASLKRPLKQTRCSDNSSMNCRFWRRWL